MKYAALIFDMDGTLVHNMPAHDQAYLDVLTEAGVPIPTDLKAFFQSIYGKKSFDILRQTLGDRYSDAEIAGWAAHKEALYRERFAPIRAPLPGLIDLLEYARRQDLPMAVATAAPDENVGFILDGLDLRRYFGAVVGGDHVRHGKPAPEIFLKSAQALGVEPSGCLVFEDATNGIEAARRAGMEAVLICTSLGPGEVAGQAHVIGAFADYTGLDLPKLLGPG